MRNIKLIVQYDGTDYAGYQVQPDAPTIQGELEAALGRLFKHPVRLQAAGRTDAGVHANGQVVTAQTDTPIPARSVAKALNDTLPVAIAVSGAVEVAAEFQPRYDAVSKLYTYRILNRAEPSPFIGRYAWHLPAELDLERMEQAAARLVGRHDFAAFEAAGSSVQDKVRGLQSLDCDREGDVIEIRARADGFLYMMVRNIVGTLVEVGLGRLEPEAVADILASRDRGQAGPTAPPQGLCLVRVDY